MSVGFRRLLKADLLEIVKLSIKNAVVIPIRTCVFFFRLLAEGFHA